MIIDDNPWTPETAAYGELPVANRARIACISRKYGALNALRAETTLDDWLDYLPDPVAAQVVARCREINP